LPTLLTQQLPDCPATGPITVFAQDETRLGLLPVVRRRMSACGVQPVATVTDPCDPFDLYGAVEPTTGAHFFLALPSLKSRAFQLWWDGFAAALPQSLHLLGLDNGAGHQATTVRWPAQVVPVFLPPSSPALHPIERLWRDLKDQRADHAVKTITELSDAMCPIIQPYSHATLRSLTGFAYFVHAVDTAQKTLYG
jgi:hypothetical protein